MLLLEMFCGILGNGGGGGVGCLLRILCGEVCECECACVSCVRCEVCLSVRVSVSCCDWDFTQGPLEKIRHTRKTRKTSSNIK